MAEKKNRDAEVITLGSGNLMFKEYDGTTMPKYSDFTEMNDLLGRILGGATLEYKGSWYEVKDDTGKVMKVILTEEDVTLKSGILTWNGKTLAKLISTARVIDDKSKPGYRTVKIGGTGNYNRKSYALCFHHEDKIDGDVWIVIRAVNQGDLSMAFAKDKETVIDAEFKCLPMDDEGTLIEYTEEVTTTATEK